MTTSGGTVENTNLEEARQLIGHLRQALESHGTIGCAQGILMERYALDAPGAMQLLKRVSMERHLRVHTLAEAVIGGDDAIDFPHPRDAG